MVQQNISFGLCFNETCNITFIVLHLNLDAHLMLLGVCVWQALLPQPPWRPIQHQTGPKLCMVAGEGTTQSSSSLASNAGWNKIGTPTWIAICRTLLSCLFFHPVCQHHAFDQMHSIFGCSKTSWPASCGLARGQSISHTIQKKDC